MFGRELRSVFTASPGRVLVGCDASALEARVEAHYIWNLDRENALELINGDIHAKNMTIFGFNPQNEKEFKHFRGKAKNGKYAIGYGCGAAKLAATIGCTVAQAKILLENYWEANIGLKTLKKQLEEAYDLRGYILSIDRRPLSVRYKHALINTLFQSAGSIIMKVALCMLDKWIKDEGLIADFVGNYHDEIQCDVLQKDAERVAVLARQSIIKAGEYFNLNVPLDAESKIGLTWAEVH